MIQLKKILAPVDFSEHARASVDYALNLAHHFDAKVILFHVVPPSPYPVVMEGIPAPKELGGLDGELGKRLRKELDALAEEIAPHEDVEKVLEKGDPARKIQEFAVQKSVDLIVMSTRGYGPFRRFLLGSVTSKVLHDVECPVFTGAHLENIPPFEPKPFRRVGCAIDLGERSESILHWASAFADSYKTKLTVIHATPSIRAAAVGAPAVAKSNKEAVQQARGRVEELLQKVGTDAAVVVESGPIEGLIEGIGESENLDVLVIGRHVDEGLLGRLQPHAYGIIRESPCPVISV